MEQGYEARELTTQEIQARIARDELEAERDWELENFLRDPSNDPNYCQWIEDEGR